MTLCRLLLVCLLGLLSSTPAAAQAAYGDEGLTLQTEDGGFSAVIGFRNQIRFTTPFDSPPADAGGITGADRQDYRLNRSRFKAAGHLFTTRLSYTVQADFVEERLRDLNVAYEAREWLQVRAGWWKIEHLLERIQSSGAQQLVDRSIVDRWFTFGRQAGVQLHGRVGGARGWGGHYYVGAFRNVDTGATGGTSLPLWLARYEWSWAGRERSDREQGDPEGSRQLQLTVGASAVRGEGAHAFYSGAGLGETRPVPGLPDPDDPSDAAGRYRTRAYGGDAVLKWRGLSLQGELHRKAIVVTRTGVQATLVGGYVMGGVRPAAIWSRVPEPLELSARIAVVDPAIGVDDNGQQERVVGASWYFQGHRSKLSADFTRLSYATPAGARDTDLRTRVQWEVTF